ncbi:hypothetical protein EGW67_05260 [Enterococcus faecium]|nr:hypothetical protein EGW67_05260 [Enterococcus faecium]
MTWEIARILTPYQKQKPIHVILPIEIQKNPTDPSNDSFGNQKKGIGFVQIFHLTKHNSLIVYIIKYYRRERNQSRSQNSKQVEKLFGESIYC